MWIQIKKGSIEDLSGREGKLKGLSLKIAAHITARKNAPGTCAENLKKIGPFLDLCVSSLRRGHANLLCIVPILSDVSEETTQVTARGFISWSRSS